MRLFSNSLKDTLSFGRKIARHARGGDIICLFGKLGAGKTALTKGIAQGLGIKKDNVVSPSFVLIREYARARVPLFHFDLYRLTDTKDILDLGYEEYFFGDGICVVEWADRLGCLMPKEFLKIELLHKDNTKRVFKFSAKGRRYKELLREIHENIRH
jgi:tRNA threonylcarbamoyladenosine biosynthesis protein TsaE